MKEKPKFNCIDDLKLSLLHDSHNIRFFMNPTKEDLELAVSKNHWSLSHMPENWQYPELCEMAVRLQPYCIRDVSPIYQSEYLCWYSLKEDPWNIHHIANPTDEMKWYSLKKDPNSSRDIKNKTMEMNIYAVSKNGELLEYADIQTEEMIWDALKQNAQNLRHVKEQTEEMIMYCLKKDPWTLEYVQNRNQNHIFTALSLMGEDGIKNKLKSRRKPWSIIEKRVMDYFTQNPEGLFYYDRTKNHWGNPNQTLKEAILEVKSKVELKEKIKFI